MNTWRLIDSGRGDAAYNMALDESIAINVRKGESSPTLRLYGWNMLTVSIGSFQKISDIDSEYCARRCIPVVRRPTGGRGVLHGDELTYSFASQNEGVFSRGLLSTYRQLGDALLSGLIMMGVKAEMKAERAPRRVLRRSPLCFESTSFGEISYTGMKLIGSAQKRWNNGFLQQGSIPYSVDYEQVQAVFGTPCILRQHPHYTPSASLRELVPDFDQDSFKKCILRSFEKTFEVTLTAALPSAQEQTLARQLSLEKYQSLRWTQGAREYTRS